MVIHSSPGSRRKKKVLPVEEVKTKATIQNAIPEKKVVTKQIPVEVKKEEEIPIIEDPTAEEFIATLPKKQNRKKVTKTIEE